MRFACRGGMWPASDRALGVALLLAGGCAAHTGAPPTTGSLASDPMATWLDPFAFEMGTGDEPLGERGPRDLPPIEAYDRDGDGRLTGGELEALHHDWDADADRDLSEEELGAGLFAAWDVNDDGVLDEPELAAARDDYTPDVIAILAGDVDDDDAPEAIDLEGLEGPSNLGGFYYWDKNDDGFVTSAELLPSMIARWDDDGDGVLEPSEWPTG